MYPRFPSVTHRLQPGGERYLAMAPHAETAVASLREAATATWTGHLFDRKGSDLPIPPDVAYGGVRVDPNRHQQIILAPNNQIMGSGQ